VKAPVLLHADTRDKCPYSHRTNVLYTGSFGPRKVLLETQKESYTCAEEGRLLRELTIKGLGTCQVRSGTARPCIRPATAKLQDMPFCERCAREQEAYFAIGELTEAGGGIVGGESLAVAIDLVRRSNRAPAYRKPYAA
jgi:hypothetical protein